MRGGAETADASGKIAEAWLAAACVSPSDCSEIGVRLAQKMLSWPTHSCGNTAIKGCRWQLLGQLGVFLTCTR